MRWALIGLLLVATPAQARWSEECTASVYDTTEKHGTRTASGIPLDDSKLTMAHRTYKLRGFMTLTNKRTGKVVTLFVTDRGPYVEGRCADISPAAARALGIDGLGKVKVEGVE